MLTWIPWAWIKRIGLAAVLLALGTVVTGYIVLRPKPVLPAEPYYEWWKQIVDDAYPGRDWSQTPLLKDALPELNERADRVLSEALLPEAAEYDDRRRVRIARSALRRLYEGEWGHPAHAYGARVIHALRPLIDEATAPIEYQHIDVANSSAEHVAVMFVFQSVEENILTYQGWDGGSWTPWFAADLRVAATEGNYNRVLTIANTWIENCKQKSSSRTGLDAVYVGNEKAWLAAECLHLAMAGHLDTATILALADLLEKPLPWADKRNHTERWKLYHEVVIRDRAKQAADADWIPVLKSLFVEPRLGFIHEVHWRDRIPSNSGAVESFRKYFDEVKHEWTVPLGDPVPQIPLPRYAGHPLRPTAEGVRSELASQRKYRMLYGMISHATAAALRVCAYRAEYAKWPDALTDAMTPEQATSPYHGGSYGYTPRPKEDTFELRFPDDRARYEEIFGLIDLKWGGKQAPGMNIIRQRPEISDWETSTLLEELGEKPTFVEEKEPMSSLAPWKTGRAPIIPTHDRLFQRMCPQRV